MEAARINEERLSRHWYPRVLAGAKAFSTNDPALSFMSALGERAIQSPDFAPSALNESGSHVYGQTTLGLDFPLYEGGARSAQAEGAKGMLESRTLEQRADRLRAYTDLARPYARLLILREEREGIEKLNTSLVEILSTYKIGSKANPVGYSGLLGLKGLRNRLAGLLALNSSRALSSKGELDALAGGLPSDWSPPEKQVGEFASKHLVLPGAAGQGVRPSAAVQAARAAAESVQQNERVEKARFLPKVGLFAEGNLYDGSRGSATSYAGGAYLSWDLFSAPNLGAVGQAEHQAAAAAARADALEESTRIERQGAVSSIEAFSQNIELMNESLPLLEEQTRVARGLFRNGTINALQLVELLSRRADLLTNRSRAEEDWIQAQVALLLNAGADEVHYGDS